MFLYACRDRKTTGVNAQGKSSPSGYLHNVKSTVPQLPRENEDYLVIMKSDRHDITSSYLKAVGPYPKPKKKVIPKSLCPFTLYLPVTQNKC